MFLTVLHPRIKDSAKLPFSLGSWATRTIYRTKHDAIAVFTCPMQYKANCPVQMKLVVSGHNVRVLQNFEHTTEHHATETEHRLTVSMIQSIQVAVHSDVRQSVNKIRRHISTEEEPCEVSKFQCVRRVVKRAKQEEMKVKSPVERGFVPNGGIGTIKEYAYNHSMKKLIMKHKDSQDSYHMGFFDMFVASSIFEDDSTDFSMFFSNSFMLTTVLRILESGWPLNFAVDLFHRFCTADVKMIGYGMITLGGKHHPVLFGTIPDKHGESKRMYQSAWQVLCHTLRRFVRDWRPCANAACQHCKETQASMDGRRAKSWLRKQQFLQHGTLPVRAFVSDNSFGLMKMVTKDVNFMGVLSIFHHLCCSPQRYESYYLSHVAKHSY